MEFSAVNRRRPSRESPLGPRAKKDGCFRRLGWVGYKEFCRSKRVFSTEPKAKVDNTLWDLQNSSYRTKDKFNNCFIIHSKYFPFHKGVSPFCSLFFCSPNITQPYPQVFLVNKSISNSRLDLFPRVLSLTWDWGCSTRAALLMSLWRHWF